MFWADGWFWATLVCLALVYLERQRFDRERHEFTIRLATRSEAAAVASLDAEAGRTLPVTPPTPESMDDLQARRLLAESVWPAGAAR